MSKLAVVAIALIAWAQAHARDVSSPKDRSVGDAKVYQLLTKQGFGDLRRGATLTRLCSIKPKDGLGGYDLYSLEVLVQAAVQVHGNAKIIAISRSGNVLGAYDSDMTEHPKCIGHGKVARMVDGERGAQVVQQTDFAPGELPAWLGGGSGFFSPASKYEGKPSADGIRLPKPVKLQ